MNEMARHEMTEAEFAELLDHHGSDRTHWPAADAERADDLLGGSAAARRELAAARAVDHWLADQRAHVAPAGLAESILERVRRVEATAPIGTRPDPLDSVFQWLTARLWRPVLVATLPVLAGFAIGVALPADTDTELASQIGTLAFVDIYEELNDAEQP